MAGQDIFFYSKYHYPSKNAIPPYFENKFARLEYIGNDLFDLSYTRHTGEWYKIFQGLLLDDCLE
ncbi:MAG: hypothetical protein KAT05_18125 [Spirochaetes bacterium]|nr:hypothetical protein [Spirochaetota bacterium]